MVLDIIQPLYSPYINSKSLFLGWNFLEWERDSSFSRRTLGNLSRRTLKRKTVGLNRTFRVCSLKIGLTEPWLLVTNCGSVCLYLSIHDADALSLVSAYCPSDIICVLHLQQGRGLDIVIHHFKKQQIMIYDAPPHKPQCDGS